MKCSILLPTYNQRQNLPIFVFLLSQLLTKEVQAIQLVIIDDNSPDGTGHLIASFIDIFKNISFKLISRPFKMGLGSAYRAGLSHCIHPYVVLMDADLSHHPKYLPQMLREMEQGADIATGTRYNGRGGVEGWSFMRKLMSRTANFVANVALQTHFTDLTGSYRVYRREVLENLMKQVTSTGYSFQMEVLLRAVRLKLRVVEVPIVFVDRLFGSSKISSGEVVKFLYTTLLLYLQQ